MYMLAMMDKVLLVCTDSVCKLVGEKEKNFFVSIYNKQTHMKNQSGHIVASLSQIHLLNILQPASIQLLEVSVLGIESAHKALPAPLIQYLRDEQLINLLYDLTCFQVNARKQMFGESVLERYTGGLA